MLTVPDQTDFGGAIQGAHDPHRPTIKKEGVNTWNWEFEVINNNKWWAIVNLTFHTTKFIPINDYLNIRLVVELEINNTCIIHQS